MTGNLAGLKPSELQALERIYRRQIPPREVISPELAATLCGLSRDLERQIGILCSRRGDIEHVFVGDSSKLMLPDVGRLRAGRGRFRGLRLVHTHLRNEALSRDDLVDLALLRLDLVAAIGVTNDGRAADVRVAHLLPPRDDGGEAVAPWEILPPTHLSRCTLDPVELITALEEEFERRAPSTRATDGSERALLVVVTIGGPRGAAPGSAPNPAARAPTRSDDRVTELRELCRTAGVTVAGVVEQRRGQADPRTLVGRGKLEDIVVRAMQVDASVLIFDPELSPGQAQEISSFTDLKVVDRTMLILDIFARRAQSRDGKLQVELAQLRYALPRLQEKNTMMSRLTGGIGGRGPGETKLEINRRRARERIHRLEKEIDHYSEQRQNRRRVRTERELPVVAIVGYTNAGKSTLLNTLTRSTVVVQDKLFATLDPTTRRLRFPRERSIIIADTVGFIRDLPRDLARAFRATLEELSAADLLLHVIDAADPAHDQQVEAVERILDELELGQKPRVSVYNKIDRVPEAERQNFLAISGAVILSARDPVSTLPLLGVIENALWGPVETRAN